MRSTERKRNVQLAMLGIALAAAMLFGAPRPAHADSLACLSILPTCMGCGPVELSPGACPTATGGATAAINICLSTVGSADANTTTPAPGDVVVNGNNTVTVVSHYGVAGTGGVDVETDQFPNTSPTGHAVVWIDPGVPVIGGLHFGIADQQSGCPE